MQLAAAGLSVEQLTLEVAVEHYEKSRPKFIAHLARLGVAPLAKRQALANAVGKHAKVVSWHRTVPVPSSSPNEPSDIQPKKWANGTAEEFMAAYHLMAKEANTEVFR